MIAKVAGGVLGLGLIGTGGVAFVKPEWLGINRETIWKPLSQDKDFSTNVSASNKYHNKFGSDFRNYLVGLDKENEGWWKEKYESIKNSKPENSKFSSVNKGYGDEGTALKKICGDAYETDNNGFQGSGETGGSKFNKEEVWKYCSLVGTTPKTVKDNTDESNSYSGKIGGNKKDDLLAAKHNDNDKLWELKNDEFFGTGVFKSNTAKPKPRDKFFEALFNKGNKDKYSLKNKCEEAYKSENTDAPSTDKQTKNDDVVKYCSFKYKQ